MTLSASQTASFLTISLIGLHPPAETAIEAFEGVSDKDLVAVTICNDFVRSTAWEDQAASDHRRGGGGMRPRAGTSLSNLTLKPDLNLHIKGVGNITFHSVWTDEGNSDEDRRPTPCRAIHEA
ncbi:hypothetical protein C8Q76DRAFT_793506 [Earliella scabrosa]|nr:hypothetical protein C8Q76DRAFT_793506 [Earliella scabrosa]